MALEAERLDLDQVQRMAASWHLFAGWLGAACGELSDECPGCTLEALRREVERLRLQVA